MCEIRFHHFLLIDRTSVWWWCDLLMWRPSPSSAQRLPNSNNNNWNVNKARREVKRGLTKPEMTSFPVDEKRKSAQRCRSETKPTSISTRRDRIGWDRGRSGLLPTFQTVPTSMTQTLNIGCRPKWYVSQCSHTTRRPILALHVGFWCH